MKRITPEEVVRVYEAKNAYALQGCWLVKDSPYNRTQGEYVPCGCVIGVMFCSLEELSSPPVNYKFGDVVIRRAQDEGYNRSYIEGLVSGFDGCADDDEYAQNKKAYHQGYKDGQAAFIALVDAERTVVDPSKMRSLVSDF